MHTNNLVTFVLEKKFYYFYTDELKFHDYSMINLLTNSAPYV